MKMNRRRFAKIAATSTLGAALSPASFSATPQVAKKSRSLTVHVFSKHLQFLDYEEMAQAAKEIGFDGVELTVRPHGHVEPKNVARDLPKAIDTIRSQGLEATMMATGINNATDPINIEVLNTASKLGIKYYRLAYYRLTGEEETSWQKTMDGFKDKFHSLGELNRKLGLHGAYQNHAGSYVGAYLPEIAYLLEGADSNWLGCQYDIRHATVDGGTAWPRGLQWVRHHIRTIVIKDFKWGEVNGKPWPINVPLGSGVVDFVGYFKQLRKYAIHPQVSMHFEFDLGGAEHGEREITWTKDAVFEALRTDLQRLHSLWEASASA